MNKPETLGSDEGLSNQNVESGRVSEPTTETLRTAPIEANALKIKSPSEGRDASVTDALEAPSNVKLVQESNSIEPQMERENIEDTPAPANALAKRYLQVDNQYHFRDKKGGVAFEDQGEKLVTQHNDPGVARSMVELAQAKMWSKLHLRGTDEFKREAWLEASIRGLETKGYKPHDVDRARLAEMRLERDADPLTPQQSTALDTLKAILKERGDSEKQVAAALTLATERFQRDRVHVGKPHSDAIEKPTVVVERASRQPVVKIYDSKAPSQQPKPQAQPQPQQAVQRSRTNYPQH